MHLVGLGSLFEAYLDLPNLPRAATLQCDTIESKTTQQTGLLPASLQAAMMDGFSVASLTATCGTLSHRALSITVELDDILEHGIFAIHISQQLKSLSAKLVQFKNAVDQLRESLSGSPSFSDEFQHVLSESLSNCDGAVAVMSKQIKRIGPETPTEAINLGTSSQYEALLESYSNLFAFETQLLSV